MASSFQAGAILKPKSQRRNGKAPMKKSSHTCTFSKLSSHNYQYLNHKSPKMPPKRASKVTPTKHLTNKLVNRALYKHLITSANHPTTRGPNLPEAKPKRKRNEEEIPDEEAQACELMIARLEEPSNKTEARLLLRRVRRGKKGGC